MEWFVIGPVVPIIPQFIVEAAATVVYAIVKLFM